MLSRGFKISLISTALIFYNVNINSQPDSMSEHSSEWEAFPIINYDSDVGFGYGGKGFVYSLLNIKESFDLTLYNSTKGERWYRFAFSFPDIQRRQGKKYPFACDLTFDYDKWINYPYYFSSFNFNTGTIETKNEKYTRESSELTIILSRGYLKDFIAEVGFRYKSINCYNFKSGGIMIRQDPSVVRYASVLFNFRMDSRTNFINPSDGFVVGIENEYSFYGKNPESRFYKLGVTAQHYLPLMGPDFVWANRITYQTVSNQSYQLLLSLGGNNTIRGLPQDRFLARSILLINTEFRFPVWKRFGGIAGLDLGKYYETMLWFGESDPSDWIINPAVGLRFYMDNFIARFDVGFDSNDLRVYFNFGHIF